MGFMRNCIIRSLKTLQAVHKNGKMPKIMLAWFSASFYFYIERQLSFGWCDSISRMQHSVCDGEKERSASLHKLINPQRNRSYAPYSAPVLSSLNFSQLFPHLHHRICWLVYDFCNFQSTRLNEFVDLFLISEILNQLYLHISLISFEFYSI